MLALVCIALTVLPISAQFDTGTIAGTITDPTGAVVPQASVTVTNEGTSAQTSLQSSDSGNFVASRSAVSGNYVVSATATGFATATSPVIALNVGGTVHVNLNLAVAATTESVAVTGTSSTIDTSSTTTGVNLNGTQVAISR